MSKAMEKVLCHAKTITSDPSKNTMVQQKRENGITEAMPFLPKYGIPFL
jgi:hypothetical protein